MKEQKKEMKKGWKKFWNGFDVCLFGLCILLFFIQWDPVGIIDYLTGYFGESIWGTMHIWIVYCWPTYVLLLIVSIIRMVKWQDCSLNPRIIFLYRIVLFLLLVICFPLLAIEFPVHSPKPLTYIMGFQKWTGARLDTEEVREWMKDLDEETIDVLKRPECLVGISLSMSGGVRKDRQGQKYIKMCNGSGHGHWGVVVYLSSEGVTLPNPEKEGITWLRLDDGAYVYRD